HFYVFLLGFYSGFNVEMNPDLGTAYQFE
ncbi:MAG: hypothetical protein ACI97Y_000761, partial [Pseudomonadales bacterium]